MATNVCSVTTGGIKPRRKGWAAFFTFRTMRRVIQTGVLAFIAFIALQHLLVGESSTTITASWEAFCPFGGFETLYAFIASGGKYVPHTHLSNLVVLGAVLLTALLTRNAFCGWICPLGFIQDLTASFSRFVQKRIPPVRRAVKTLKQRGARFAILDRYLRYVKYLVLIWAVAGAAYWGTMVFREYDPWAALWNLTEWSIGFGTLVLGLTLVSSLFIERPWCRYACPLGAATGLVGLLSPVQLRRESDACKSCALCSRSCPMGLEVDTATKITSPDCIGCLECIDVCPREGALELKLSVPVIGR